MRLIQKISILCFACTLGTSYADYVTLECVQPECCASEQCCSDNSFYVSGDYLYWKPTQGGMTYALSIDSIATGPIGSDNSEIQQKSKWGQGFRVGVGVDLPMNQADVRVTWTHFNHTAHSSNDDPFILGTQLLGPVNPFTLGGSGSAAGNAESEWKLRLDTIEFNLAYQFSSGVVELQPYVGVAATRIHQNQTINYNNFLDTTNGVFLDATITQKNNFEGVGPKFGIEGGWTLGQGFGIMGNLGAAFYYGNSKNPVESLVVNDPIGFPNPDYTVNYSKHRLIPAFQGQVGITWSLANTNNFAVELSALYEVQYFVGTWRNQNSQIQSLYIADAGYDNLMLNGFTGRLEIKF